MYLDAAATTPLHPEVAEAMQKVFEIFGNAGSKHVKGFEAHKRMENALERIANIMGVPRDCLAISHGGTEANRRVMWALRKRFGHDQVWASSVEHSSLLDEVRDDRCFDPVSFEGLPSNPKVIALMAVNNETGGIFDVKKLRKEYPEALIVSDWVQGVGKLHWHSDEEDVPSLDDVDFATFSAHKFNGPKGVGLIYMKNPELFPEISKDTHTKDLIAVSGMAKAFELIEKNDHNKISAWTDQIENFIAEQIPDYKIHHQDLWRVSGVINVALGGVRGSELMTILSQEEGVCISTGSACTSDILSPTHVIKAIQPDPTWQFPIRISLHAGLQDQNITDFCEILQHYVEEMRKKNPNQETKQAIQSIGNNTDLKTHKDADALFSDLNT